MGLKGQEAVLQHLEWHVAGKKLPRDELGGGRKDTALLHFLAA